jgi:putative membrane protein
MSRPDDETGWRRLHPLSLVFRVGAAARRLLFPLVALLFVSRGEGSEIVLAVFFVPAVVVAIVRYLSYGYRLGADELVIREGIVTRNERHVPYARIQNIDLVQGLVQRWLDVAEARFETASGKEPEAVMRVLSLAEIAEVRERVFRGAREGAQAEPAPELVYRARVSQLALLGLTSNRGLAVVAAAIGALWQLEPWGYGPESLARKIARVDPSQATGLVALGAFVALVIVLKLLSAAWTIVRLHGFVLEAQGDDLSARYGLLTRIAATVPRPRIQRLAIHRGPLHRWLAHASVQIETAGRSAGSKRGDESSGRAVERLWLAPWIDDRALHDLVARALPGVDLSTVVWQPLAPRAGRRMLVRGLVLVLLLGVGPLVLLGPRPLVLLAPLLALVAIHARLWTRRARYALLDDAVVWESGWWTRRTSLVPYEKIQVVALSESPFDRRNGMASLGIDTAGARSVSHSFVVPYLPKHEAGALQARLVAETSARAFRW